MHALLVDKLKAVEAEKPAVSDSAEWCQNHWPAVRLTTEAVPAVMASTWEWISCFDSSILFWIHILDA